MSQKHLPIYVYITNDYKREGTVASNAQICTYFIHTLTFRKLNCQAYIIKLNYKKKFSANYNNKNNNKKKLLMNKI